MNKCQLGGFFGVSRATVNDWARRGAPVAGGVGPVARWLVQRDLERYGVPATRLPALAGELADRQAALERRIAEVNAMPASPLRAVLARALELERNLLALPARILGDATAESIPERLLRAVLEAVRGEPAAEGPSGDTAQ